MKTFMGLKIKQRTEDDCTDLLGFEPHFGHDVKVATVFHALKQVVPCHGYFYPNKYGVISEKYARRIGYKFNNQ